MLDNLIPLHIKKKLKKSKKEIAQLQSYVSRSQYFSKLYKSQCPHYVKHAIIRRGTHRAEYVVADESPTIQSAYQIHLSSNAGARADAARLHLPALAKGAKCRVEKLTRAGREAAGAQAKMRARQASLLMASARARRIMMRPLES